jgi:hypothetical protein
MRRSHGSTGFCHCSLKTTKALGLEVPAAVLHANEIIK